MFSKKERFFSRKKLLQNDKDVLSLRQKSRFCFDEESVCFSKEALCFRKRKDSSVAKSSFRMTKTYCHSEREAVFLRLGIFLSFRQKSCFALTRNLFLSARNFNVFEKGKILQSQKAPSKRQRRVVIPTEKLFLL
jgi:hypothetical protein